MAPVTALQQQVLNALRGGMDFFKASKEGGSHIFFDGTVFRRNDDGEAPDLRMVYTDAAAVIDGLRRFFDWDARQDSFPHAKPEIDIWRYIHGKLRPH